MTCSFLSLLTAQWEWQYYSPTGNNLNDVVYLPSGIIVTVGERGMILRSTDDGSTWAIVPSGTTANINRVRVLQDSVLDIAMQLVAFTDSNTLSSTDSGASWQLSQVVLLDEVISGHKIFVLVYNELLYSDDGGMTWSSLPLPAKYNKLYADPMNQLWILGRGSVLRLNGLFLEEMKDSISNDHSPYFAYTSIYFTDSLNGWLTASDNFLNSYDALLFKTSNGGTHWQLKKTFWYGFSINNINFLDSLNGWMILGGGLVQTTDGGNTWLSSQATNVTSFALKDSLHLITVGNVGTIFQTNNGGIAWIRRNGGEPQSFGNVFFVNRWIGYIGDNSSPQIFKTTDGGFSFSKQQLPDSGMGVQGIFFIDSLRGWVTLMEEYGQWGSIAATTDGGLNWNNQTGRVRFRIHDIWFTDSLHGFAITGGGSIRTTSDGGTTWSFDTSGEPEYAGEYQCIQFLNRHIGWIGGPYIYKTTNGGMTWCKKEVDKTSDVTITGLSIVDSLNLWAVSSNRKLPYIPPKLHYTTDGGERWCSLNPPTNGWLYDVWFATPERGYIAGENGIYKTIDAGKTWMKEKTPVERSMKRLFFTNRHEAWAVGRNAIFRNSNINIMDGYSKFVEVVADKPAYRANEPVVVTVRYRNYSDSTVTLNFTSTCQHNFCIGGQQCLSDSQGCRDMLTEVTLQPREIASYTDTISNTYSLGIHRIVGWVGDPMPGALYGIDTTSFTVYSDSMTIYLSPDWNLVSLPMLVADNKVRSLFPRAVSTAFTYSKKYQRSDSLQVGRGYWLKFGNEDSIVLNGVPILAETISVIQGWNMIGSISVPIEKSSVESLPGGIISSPFIGLDCGYSGCDAYIRPGKSYWVKVTENGKIILRTK
ncbi:MAG: hypothetical protein HYZ34_10850 [Ignavibacteriae bacterium]|nr:hypothetical protein [Ignavibacteriota bacterium]